MLTLKCLCLAGLAAAALAAPQFSIEEPVVDAGLHLYYRDLSHVFEIQNKGDEPLALTVEKVSCGCTTPSLADEPVPPGGTAELELTYRPKQKYFKVGPQSFAVGLATNDPAQPSPVLKVEVNLVDHVHAQPSELSFSPGDKAGENEQLLRLSCLADGMEPGATAEVTAVTSTAPGVTITEAGTTRTETMTVTSYRVSHESDVAQWADGLVIVETTSSRVPRIEIPVKAELPALLEATPPRALFGVVRSEEPLEKQIVLRRVGAAVPATCKSSNPAIVAALEEDATNGWHLLKVRLIPPKVSQVVPLKAEVLVFDSAGLRLCGLPVVATLAPAKKDDKTVDKAAGGS